MIEDEREKIKEELGALCLQLGLHPETFDNDPFIDEALKRRREYAERSNLPVLKQGHKQRNSQGNK